MLLSVTDVILQGAQDRGIQVVGPEGKGNPLLLADKILLNGPPGKMGEPFVLHRVMMQPFESCNTGNQDYDVVVSSILAAAKKIAPNIFEISAYGDPEPRRILAMNKLSRALKFTATNPEARKAFANLLAKKAKFPKGKSVDVPEWMRGKAEEYRAQGESGKAKSLEEAASEWEQYEGEMDGNQKAALLQTLGKKAAKGPDSSGRNWKKGKGQWVWSGGKDAPSFTVVEKEAPFGKYYKFSMAVPGQGKFEAKGQKTEAKMWFSRAADLFKKWNSAAGFDLSKTPEKWSKKAAAGKQSEEREAKFEKGKSVDVAKWLKDNGHAEAASEWEQFEGKVEDLDKKAAARRARSFVHEFLTKQALMQIHVVAAENPTGKLASISNSKTRVALAAKRAEKWIQDAIKRPGRVRDYLGISKGETIPMGKLDAAISKVKASGDKSLLAALMLAKRLKTEFSQKG